MISDKRSSGEVRARTHFIEAGIIELAGERLLLK